MATITMRVAVGTPKLTKLNPPCGALAYSVEVGDSTMYLTEMDAHELVKALDVLMAQSLAGRN